MMMTKPDAEKIAQDAHAARPEWDTAGIMAALLKVRDRDPQHVRAAALHAARNPANRTPAVIALDGEHWTLTVPAPRRGPATKCKTHDLEESSEGICRACRADRLVSGEEYPIGVPGRIPRSVDGRCCGTSHAPHAPCPGHIPPPATWRQQVEASIAYYRRRAPAHMRNLEPRIPTTGRTTP